MKGFILVKDHMNVKNASKILGLLVISLGIKEFTMKNLFIVTFVGEIFMMKSPCKNMSRFILVKKYINAQNVEEVLRELST